MVSVPPNIWRCNCSLLPHMWETFGTLYRDLQPEGRLHESLVRRSWMPFRRHGFYLRRSGFTGDCPLAVRAYRCDRTAQNDRPPALRTGGFCQGLLEAVMTE